MEPKKIFIVGKTHLKQENFTWIAVSTAKIYVRHTLCGKEV